MRVRFEVIPYVLKFRFEAGTSRGVLTDKPTWFIKVWQQGEEDVLGWGEASPLKGLSADYSEDYPKRLRAVLDHLEGLDIPEQVDLRFIADNSPEDMPSVRFGLETALLDLWHGGKRTPFPGDFASGTQRIPINGLVWMGNEAFMQKQIEEKLKKGFSTIKMKVGAIDFEKELGLLEMLRDRYTSDELTLRVDANGAFSDQNVDEKLEALAALDIHSIEQPVKPGQPELMRRLSEESLVPIALDEELIGLYGEQEKRALLEAIKPQYIILKPSLLGGFVACEDWINLAESMGIGWWMTSMLESNIGLNAIAQFSAQYDPILPQGLGTGQLYHNNIASPLRIKRGYIQSFAGGSWKIPL